MAPENRIGIVKVTREEELAFWVTGVVLFKEEKVKT